MKSFWNQATGRGTFLCKHFEIRPLAKEKMSFNDFFSVFSSGGNFVQLSGTILANSVKGHKKNTFCEIYFEIRPMAMEEMFFKGFSIFSSGCHLVQPSRTILAALVEGHWKNTSVQIFWNLQIFWNRAIGQGWDVVLRFFICSSGIYMYLVQWNGTIAAILEFDQQNFSLF